MNDFVFLFSEFSDFCDFSGAARRSGERDGRKEKERQRNRAQRANSTALRDGRTQNKLTTLFTYSESRGRRIS